ncbi:SixA phosphatase family protein [Hymenobacter arizonensis]|uniref:Histidine phosphatase superfamily (Branch 1) n=1 Tax=Hymenobacter arizonensis TaxID=1227077 RepID=A0A1I5TM16_HYMAR|nr:histidine phosphatase family protein [Hymenobacter arizonensis]SFP84134.1 Histidine phosphatase superfamily (branch 1) [Hymenobacter arizonensis]
MRTLGFSWIFFLVGLLAVAAAVPAAKPPVTKVYIVRHAEKDLTPGLADPLLTPAGEARARALHQQLRRAKPAALFTTDTKRTRATLAPLAEATKLTPQVYDPRQQATLAEQIRRDYAGKTVVVVGHSNTLLPLVAALGAQAPLSEIKDEEYSYLFEVRIEGNGTPTVKMTQYGAR